VEPTPLIQSDQTSLPWGPRQVGLSLIGLVAIWVLTVALASVVPDGLSSMTLAIGLVLEVGLVVLAIGMGPGNHPRRMFLLGLGPTQRSIIGWAAVGAFLSMGLTIVYTIVINALSVDALLPPDLPDRVDLEDVLPLAVVVIVLVGPFTEELFYRGFAYTGLASRWGFWPAAYVSAGMFAISHLDIGLLGPTFIAGMAFAWIYKRTGSLWPAILAHSMQNALALAVAVS
jgi:membrane protease YdiL (CAAX protease family)